MAGFVHELRVRYHETDAQHHVYNARYLEYLDVAMTEYLRDLGWPYAELVALGFDPVVGKIEIEFQRPAGFDEILRIEVRPARLGNSSLDLAFAVRSGDDPVATATISYVNYDPATRASRPIPDVVRERLGG
jgi:acyl-CoA thioester hydrolase